MAGQFKKLHNSGYWRKCVWLIVVCLAGWLLATLLPLALAQIGMQGTILGWPSVFALAAFGVPLVYMIIIAIYSLAMDRLDRQERLQQGNQSESSPAVQPESTVSKPWP